MKELIEEVEFENDEKVVFCKYPGYRFVVTLSVGTKFSREKYFDKKYNAEDFFDSFLEGNDIRKYINQMLEDVSGDFKISLLPYL